MCLVCWVSQFAGRSATFNVTGLTAGTPYVFVVTARAGIETDTDGVSFTTDAPIVVTREASITNFFVVPSETGGQIQATVDRGTHAASAITVRWSYFLTSSIQSVSAGESSVSGGVATGSLSGLAGFTGYTARAELVRAGRVVDVATFNFTTLAPQPKLRFSILTIPIRPNGAYFTHVRIAYIGVRSISIDIGIDDDDDIAYNRQVLNPTLSYNTSDRRNDLEVGGLDRLIVTATGPNGAIQINYGNPGGNTATRNFYESRGWIFSEMARFTATRTYGPGVYT